MTEQPRSDRIVFLCVANSARSQIAEALARSTAPPGVEIFSAGSEPSSVNPLAIRVMVELGVSMASHYSKGLDAVPIDRATAVIALCAEEQCPVLPAGTECVSWALPDPASSNGTEEERLAAFRNTRDEIARRVESLWTRTDPES